MAISPAEHNVRLLRSAATPLLTQIIDVPTDELQLLPGALLNEFFTTSFYEDMYKNYVKAVDNMIVLSATDQLWMYPAAEAAVKFIIEYVYDSEYLKVLNSGHKVTGWSKRFNQFKNNMLGDSRWTVWGATNKSAWRDKLEPTQDGLRPGNFTIHKMQALADIYTDMQLFRHEGSAGVNANRMLSFFQTYWSRVVFLVLVSTGVMDQQSKVKLDKADLAELTYFINAFNDFIQLSSIEFTVSGAVN